GTSSASTTVASSGAWLTSMSPTGSSDGTASGFSSKSATITAPIRCAMRKKPQRVQLSATRSRTTRDPGTTHAAAATNAADDGSPGTITSSSSSSSTGDM